MYIPELLKQVLTDIKVDRNNQEIIFTRDDGKKFKMYHEQDCCESVVIDDINGNINDLIGYPLHLAEETSNNLSEPSTEDNDYQPESCTWTFYRFGTVKGYVDIRWYGESNGYYSEAVYIVEVTDEL